MLGKLLNFFGLSIAVACSSVDGKKSIIIHVMNWHNKTCMNECYFGRPSTIGKSLWESRTYFICCIQQSCAGWWVYDTLGINYSYSNSANAFWKLKMLRNMWKYDTNSIMASVTNCRVVYRMDCVAPDWKSHVCCLSACVYMNVPCKLSRYHQRRRSFFRSVGILPRTVNQPCNRNLLVLVCVWLII